jgi:23S rRNA pseudouridine1911/1915/1917 synthase
MSVTGGDDGAGAAEVGVGTGAAAVGARGDEESQLFVVTVPGALDGVRVDRAVAMLTGVTRSVAADLVATGRVQVEGRPVGAGRTPLVAGQRLTVELLPSPPIGLSPDPLVPFAVVHEDPTFVVVDKPPGVVVHPGAGNPTGTLIAGLLHRFPDIAALGEGPSDPQRPGIVHRIDRGTSGLLIVARTADAYRDLVSQMGARAVGRRYLALVAGHVPDARGVVEAPIGRSSRTPALMTVSASGRPARTSYEVLERLEVLAGVRGPMGAPATLLACTLDTGRTHQIRVHLSAIGHPVVGDDRYGRPPAGVLPSGRLFLHAAELAIDHPVTGLRMAWTSPLPPDLRSVVGGAGRLGMGEAGS